MKEIIISDKNAERIMDAFKTAQGRATARTIDSYEQLMSILKGLDARLCGISKKALEGTKVEYNFAQKFPNAYKYAPESTHFIMVYSKGAWRLAKIERGTCPNRVGNGYGYDLELSEAGKAAVLDMYK